MAQNIPEEFDFHFLKSSNFRVVHCDGVWGGTTPRGYITMSIYSERSPFPQKVTHEVAKNGAIDKEKRREGKEGIVREVEVEVVLDLATAKTLIPWLQGHIQFLENQQRQIQNKGEE